MGDYCQRLLLSSRPDAFFWVGESLPSCSSESIKKTKNYLLDPYTVGSSDYYREEQPILPAYDGTQGDLVLTLPAGASTSDLKWICVWCRMYAHNFGTIEIDN